MKNTSNLVTFDQWRRGLNNLGNNVPTPLLKQFTDFQQYSLALGHWVSFSSRQHSNELVGDIPTFDAIEFAALVNSGSKNRLGNINEETIGNLRRWRDFLSYALKEVQNARQHGLDNIVEHYSRTAGVQPNFHVEQRRMHKDFVNPGVRKLEAVISDLQSDLGRANSILFNAAKLVALTNTLKEMTSIVSK